MMRFSFAVRVAPVVAIALLAGACHDDRRDPVAPVEEAKPEMAVSTIAYLTISDSAPRAGSSVVVTAHASGSDVTFGSFAARLTFAPGGLTYVREAGEVEGMRAVNPQPGEVALAGVKLDGFSDGRLFSVELHVVDPAAVATLALSVSELTGVDYRNESANLSVQKAIRFVPTL